MIDDRQRPHSGRESPTLGMPRGRWHRFLAADPTKSFRLRKPIKILIAKAQEFFPALFYFTGKKIPAWNLRSTPVV
jgi:hypothetical protein